MLGRNYDDVDTRCTNEDCENGCVCTNSLTLPLNKTVQLVLSSYALTFYSAAHHSIHLHGYDFAVVKVGYPPYNSTTGFRNGSNEDLQCDNSLCSLVSWTKTDLGLNLLNPPIDTKYCGCSNLRLCGD